MTYPYSELPTRYVDALGIHTAYYTAGEPNGRPVILLHGTSSSADVYRETMHELADEFWLIAPDLPGFGHSEHTEPYTLSHLVEWLAAFRHALDLPPALLVGHSFGGALAVSFAASDPEDVLGLLLVAPAVLASNAYPDFLKRAGIGLGLVDLSTTVAQSQPLVVEQLLRLPFYDADRLDESVWPRRARAYELSRASADVVKALAFQDLRPLLAQLSPPVTVIWGENDPVLPVSDAETLEAMLPQWPIFRLPQCGHIPMLEQPAQFRAVARAFFRGEDAAAALAAVPRWQILGAQPPVIAVFGSSAPQPGTPPYEEARAIGRLLAENNLTVATGGYIGTMTAVSQGAAEAGGHVIGVTSEQIEQFRTIGPNRWVAEEIRYVTLRDRLLHLVTHNDGMIALPGGIGTLSEVTLAWSFLQVGEIPPRPLVLLGDLWRQTISAFQRPEYIRQTHLDLLHFADTPEAAVAFVVEHVKQTHA